ncbi:MAG TPA: fasciclin domain-containing protein [Flavobacterium sp.]|uniref:fasciclin domain-containing protein n=1 Tax=unclassified Flavobacterium TaxID=196869 RepID=UPI000E9A2060|nr:MULTISPECIES: fasciclin domain-containing protein [unclassified Flavobacterium]HBI01141.1 fasciclin [Flavobacterium sp.]HRE76725.1 fasciclin domain-containing protein [Flavobacterium sp.]
MKNGNFLKSVLFAFLAITTFSCSDDDDAGAPQSNTIAAIASRTPDLSILVQALDRAGLVAAVDGTTALTVFAPTNDAFEDFLDDNGFANLNAVPVDVLRQVLLNHVVAGAVQSTQLSTGYIETSATFGGTPTGNALNMYVNTAAGVRLNGVSSVVTPNIIASNGVVHVVDAVIGLPTVGTFAKADGNFSGLAAALTAQGLVPTLEGTAGSPFTVFAPTNAAFAALDAEIPGVVASLSSDELTAVLTYHVVAGANALSTSLTQGQVLTTFETGTLTVGLTGGAKLTDERGRITNIVAVDVQAANGVIHVLDNVLLPTFD